jgi:hypothetical protein
MPILFQVIHLKNAKSPLPWPSIFAL